MKCEYRWRPTIEWYPIVPDVLLATTVLVKFASVEDEVARPAALASISALISIEFVVAVPVDEVARLMKCPDTGDAGSPGNTFLASKSGEYSLSLGAAQ